MQTNQTTREVMALHDLNPEAVAAKFIFETGKNFSLAQTARNVVNAAVIEAMSELGDGFRRTIVVQTIAFRDDIDWLIQCIDAADSNRDAVAVVP